MNIKLLENMLKKTNEKIGTEIALSISNKTIADKKIKDLEIENAESKVRIKDLETENISLKTRINDLENPVISLPA